MVMIELIGPSFSSLKSSDGGKNAFAVRGWTEAMQDQSW